MRCSLLAIVSLIALAGDAAATPVSYGRDVRPILSENCFYCHGQDTNQRKAEVRLDTLDGQRANGQVTPGKPDESELVRRILSDDASELDRKSVV